jgi:hypothetical protein
MSVYSEIAFSAAEMPVDTVCISYRNSSDDSSLRSNLAATAVSDGAVTWLQGLHLKNLALE